MRAHWVWSSLVAVVLVAATFGPATNHKPLSKSARARPKLSITNESAATPVAR
jgi:hypothetical protein